MLTKNSKLLLKKLSGNGTSHAFQMHTFFEAAELSGLSFHETIAACKHLESLGYLEIQYRQSSGTTQMETVRLTELGAHRKAQRWERFWSYIAANWIAFLALVFSILSLFIQINAIAPQ